MITFDRVLTSLGVNPLGPKKINNLIKIVDTTIPGKSYEEIEKFKKDLAVIARKNKVKAKIYDARRDLPELHTGREEEFFSQSVAVKLKRKGREAVTFFVNYFGKDGRQEESFINRFFAAFQINAEIAKNKKIKL